MSCFVEVLHRFPYYIVMFPTGPVRGIDFHKQQPLFVSGGDDYKIKVITASVLHEQQHAYEPETHDLSNV